jgi:hypothetical protein
VLRRIRAVCSNLKIHVGQHLIVTAMGGVFFATLAQITIGILAIFGTVLVSYEVYVEARQTQYEDAARQDRLEIAAVLSRWRSEGPVGLNPLLPKSFGEKYADSLETSVSWRSFSPPKPRGGAYSVSRIVKDLACIHTTVMCGPLGTGPSDTDLFSVIEDLKDDELLKGRWKGRVYVWAIGQIILEETGGPSGPREVLFQQGTSQEEMRKIQVVGRAFPVNPEGPGFHQWRRDFETLDSSVRLLQAIKTPMVSDYQAICKTIGKGVDSHQVAKEMQVKTESFFSDAAVIREKLSDLDRQAKMRSNYEGGRIHLSRIGIPVGIALCVGVVVPMLLLSAESKLKPLRLLITVVAIGSLSASFYELIRDVRPTPPNNDEGAYLTSRWYQPMAEFAGGAQFRTQYASPLYLALFADSLDSPDYDQFPKPLKEAIEAYVIEASHYNEALKDRDEDVIRDIGRALKAHSSMREPSPLEIQASEWIDVSDFLSDGSAVQIESILDAADKRSIIIDAYASDKQLYLPHSPKLREVLSSAIQNSRRRNTGSVWQSRCIVDAEKTSKTAGRLLAVLVQLSPSILDELKEQERLSTFPLKPK